MPAKKDSAIDLNPDSSATFTSKKSLNKAVDLNNVHDLRTKQYLAEWSDFLAEEAAKEDIFYEESLKTFLDKNKDDEEIEFADRIMAKKEEQRRAQHLEYMQQKEKQAILGAPVVTEVKTHKAAFIKDLKKIKPELYKAIIEYQTAEQEFKKWQDEYRKERKKWAEAVVEKLASTPIQVGDIVFYFGNGPKGWELKAELKEVLSSTSVPAQEIDRMLHQPQHEGPAKPPIVPVAMAEQLNRLTEGMDNKGNLDEKKKMTTEQAQAELCLPERQAMLQQLVAVAAIRRNLVEDQSDVYRKIQEKGHEEFKQLGKCKTRAIGAIVQHVEVVADGRKMAADIKVAQAKYFAHKKLMKEKIDRVSALVSECQSEPAYQQLVEKYKTDPAVDEYHTKLQSFKESPGLHSARECSNAMLGLISKHQSDPAILSILSRHTKEGDFAPRFKP